MKRGGIIFGLAFLSVGLLAVVVWQARLLQRQPAESPRPAINRGGGKAEGTSSSASPDDKPELVGKLRSSLPLVGEPSAGRLARQNIVSPAAANRPPFDWRQVESEDYQAYVKNLRAIGCPEQTVQDIVTADLRQAFAAKRAEAMAERYRDFKFWKADPEESGARADLESKRRTVDDELSDAARALLGAEVTVPPASIEWQQAALAQQLQFLPDDKREPTQTLLLRYAEIDAQVRELSWGHGTPENPDERLRVLAAYEQKKTALHELLTPAEYEQVELTVSWTADNLRRAMTKFEPTEEEFRLIFHEWRIQDEQLAQLLGTGQPDPGNEPVFAKIKEVLSPERYEKYRETWWK